MWTDDYYKSKENQQRISNTYSQWNNRYVYGLYHDESSTHEVWGDKIRRLKEYIISAHIKYYPKNKMKIGAVGRSIDHVIYQTKRRYPFIVIDKAMMLR